MPTLHWQLLLALLPWACFVRAAINVTLPAAPPNANATVVYSTFLGVSFELSYINEYFGNTTDEIPQPMLNYVAALKARSSAQPVKLRIGGNSMDSATYLQSQSTMIEVTSPATGDDVLVNFGPTLFDVMQNISATVGGARYLIGLELRNASSTDLPLLAGNAQQKLGDNLDAFLLGNEPDLYAAHQNKPPNYGINDYIGDYWVAFANLENTDDGDVLSTNKIAGPTTCCNWNLIDVMNSGWLNDFSDHLKYLTLQHYPQNNCFGSYPYQLDYYLAHANAVALAQWQAPALQQLAATPPATRKPLVMSEFNSASCGGIPGISDTFGAALWTADYALQLASVGYTNAFLHTRELGVSYNLFDYPSGAGGAWRTNPPFYALLAVAEALQGTNGSAVADLNVTGSMADLNAGVAGYAVYDGGADRSVRAAVLFNFANASGSAGQFAVADGFFVADAGNLTVRYMTASSVNEETAITWGGQTGAGRGDGTLVSDPSSSWADKSVSCTGGCSIDVPGPGMALVFVDPPASTNTSGGATGTSSGEGSNGGTSTVAAPSSARSVRIWPMTLGLCISVLAVLLSC